MAFLPIPAPVYCGSLAVVQNLFSCPFLIGYGIDRYPMTQIRVLACLVMVTLAVPPASAWNIPTHMLSAAISYQILQQDNPQTIQKVRALLEKHPWYANQWQGRLQDVPVADHGLVLFMQAARWADDIRTQDKAQSRPSWHYINLPFKPENQPANVLVREPEPVTPRA
jgi:hypothetical protein